jgi:hypothetical protein
MRKRKARRHSITTEIVFQEKVTLFLNAAFSRRLKGCLCRQLMERTQQLFPELAPYLSLLNNVLSVQYPETAEVALLEGNS